MGILTVEQLRFKRKTSHVPNMYMRSLYVDILISLPIKSCGSDKNKICFG